ncbi:MAG: MBL fold metallo-hydrolase [Lachnospiraceae bacterium]|nr:MBL fold metallo-hydrolase [Lachnospiraceae bacterium]
MKICSLSSGSSGNCIFVSSGLTKILVDAGTSGARITQELSSIGESIDDIDALLVTHEHIDHIKSIGVLARKQAISIYGTKGTLEAALSGRYSVGKIDEGLLNHVIPGNPFMIGDILVSPFSVSHDAADPVAYCFECNGKKIGTATDLGFYDDSIVKNLLNSDLLYLESNHDVHMLEAGVYPYSLKERVKGKKGHLSNDDCAKLVVKLCRGSERKTAHVILAHLSEENNFPELAYETVNSEVIIGLEPEKRPEIHVAPRFVHSFVAEI